MWAKHTLSLLAASAAVARPLGSTVPRLAVRQAEIPAGMNFTGPQCGDDAMNCVNFPDLASASLAREYCVNVVYSNRTFESANATDLQVGGIVVPFSVNVTGDTITVLVPGATVPGVARLVDNFGCQAVFDEIITPVYREVSADEENVTGLTNTTGLPYVSDFVWPEALQDTPTALEGIDYAALSAILDKEFNLEANETYVSQARTKAVVVIYNGSVVAEGYADWLNITADTPLIGWSNTKSLTTSLVGMRIAQGKMELDSVAPNSYWTEQEKLTRNITVRNIGQMTTGVAWNEDYGPVTDVTRMLFTAPDAAAYVARRDQAKIPGSYFFYSSGDTNLLSHALRLSFNDDGDNLAYWRYPKVALFDPIGASSFRLMTDSMGTFVGSSYSIATARDWARVGQLYLNDGEWDGRQVVPADWVKLSSTPTEVSGGEYGLGWWILPANETANGPETAYSMRGYGGQAVTVFPSKDLVVVRMGYTVDFPDFDRTRFTTDIASIFPVSS